MKKLIFIALLSLIGMTNVFAQQETTTTAEKVFDVVDEMPSFPGGKDAMMELLSKNIKLENAESLERTFPLYIFLFRQGGDEIR